VAHGAWKTILDFGGNPNHDRVKVRLGLWAESYWVCFSLRLFNSNYFEVSAVLAEVCGLLSAMLVKVE